MADGLNPKQEKFCQLYAETGNASQSHKDAGYGISMSDKTRNEEASKMVHKHKIATRLAELAAHHQERHNITMDSITQDYLDDRGHARKADQHAVAIGATEKLAKLHRLLDDHSSVEHQGNVNFNTYFEPKPDGY